MSDGHTERILHLFPRAASEDRENDIAQREFNSDPYEQILALYKEYRPRLLGYMRSLYLNRDEAEEVVQETFMELTNAVMAEGLSKVCRAGFVNTAHHLAVDVIKKEGKERRPFFAILLSLSSRLCPTLRWGRRVLPKERAAARDRERSLAIQSATTSVLPHASTGISLQRHRTGSGHQRATGGTCR